MRGVLKRWITIPKNGSRLHVIEGLDDDVMTIA